MYIFVCMLALNQWSVRLLEIHANGCLAAAAIVLCSVWMPACISTPHLRCIQCVYVCVWASVRLTVWLTDCLLSSYPLLAAIFVVFLVNIEQIIFDTITHTSICVCLEVRVFTYEFIVCMRMRSLHKIWLVEFFFSLEYQSFSVDWIWNYYDLRLTTKKTKLRPLSHTCKHTIGEYMQTCILECQQRDGQNTSSLGCLWI